MSCCSIFGCSCTICKRFSLISRTNCAYEAHFCLDYSCLPQLSLGRSPYTTPTSASDSIRDGSRLCFKKLCRCYTWGTTTIDAALAPRLSRGL